jgi:hypothetical protein
VRTQERVAEHARGGGQVCGPARRVRHPGQEASGYAGAPGSAYRHHVTPGSCRFNRDPVRHEDASMYRDPSCNARAAPSLPCDGRSTFDGDRWQGRAHAIHPSTIRGQYRVACRYTVHSMGSLSRPTTVEAD